MNCKKYIFFILLFPIVLSCKTLSLQGEQVKITKHKSDIEQCESLGEVKANPPFIGPNDAEKTLRNKTGELGGDVLLITDMSAGAANGFAYDCGGEYTEQ